MRKLNPFSRHRRHTKSQSHLGNPAVPSASATEALKPGTQTDTSDPSTLGTASDNIQTPPNTETQGAKAGEVSKHSLFPEGNTLGLRALYGPSDNATPTADIIFVHGLTGNSFDTWFKECSNNTKAPNVISGPAERRDGTYWPVDLLPPNIQAPIRVLAFGYDAEVVKTFGAVGQGSLRDHADSLLSDLSRRRELDGLQNRKVIFVAHSLGGLVVKKMLCLSEGSIDASQRSIDQCTIGVVFLGVPHKGSSFAPFARGMTYLLKTLRKRVNVSLTSLLKPGSEVLTDIEKSFGIWLRKNNHRIYIAPFFEELELPVVGKVVDQESAQVLGYIPISIHANHMEMTKFSSVTDLGFQRVKEEVEICLLRFSQQQLKQNELTNAQEELLRSLHFNSIGKRFQNIHDPFPKTFEWIWRQPDFVDWLSGRTDHFWIHGKPGSGKSTLLKFLNDNLQCHIPQDSVLLTHCFDFDGNDLSKSSDGFLRSLVWQILKASPHSMQGVMPSFETMKGTLSSLEWTTQDLQLAWTQAIGLLSARVVVLVDALDESKATLEDIAEMLLSLPTKADHQVSICATSRSHSELRYHFREWKSLKMEDYSIKDIELFTNNVCRRIINESQGLTNAHHLANDICQRAQGMFLWVKLAAQAVSRGFSRGENEDRLRERVNDLHPKLSSLYLQILQGMDESDQRDLKLMLAIVICAKRPLSIIELGLAVSVQMDGVPDVSVSRMRRRLNAIGIGFMEESEDRVRLSHQTVLNFVESSPTVNSGALSTADVLLGHRYLLKACCLHLQKPGILDQPRAEDDRLGNEQRVLKECATNQADGAFSRYAVLYWQIHADMARQLEMMSEDDPSNYLRLSERSHLRLLSWFMAICWEEKSLWLRGFDEQTVVQAALLQFFMLELIGRSAMSIESVVSWPNRSTTRFPRGVFSLARSPDSGIRLTRLTEYSFQGLQLYLQTAMQDDTQNSDSVAKATRPMSPILQSKTWSIRSWSTHPIVAFRPITEGSERDNAEPTAFRYVRVDKDELAELEHLIYQLGNSGKSDTIDATGTDLKRSTARATFESVAWHVLEDGVLSARRAIQVPFTYHPGTPLQYAALYALPNLVHKLLVARADPNFQAKTSAFGTPLMAAIFSLQRATERGGEAIKVGFSVHVSIVGMLLDSGADPNLAANGVTMGLRSPLEAACRIFQTQSLNTGVGARSILQVIKMLFNYGALSSPLIDALVGTVKNHELRALFRSVGHRSTLTKLNIRNERADLRNLLQKWAAELSNLQTCQSEVPEERGSRPEPSSSAVSQPLKDETDALLSKMLQMKAGSSMSPPSRSYSFYPGNSNATYTGVVWR